MTTGMLSASNSDASQVYCTEFGNGQSNPQNYIDEEKIEWPQIFEVIEKENKGFLNTAKITNFPSLILIDDKGVVLCPAGAKEMNDGLSEATKANFEDYNNCQYFVNELGATSCSFMSPVRNWNAEKNQFEIEDGYFRH
jgi:hypothetical protein